MNTNTSTPFFSPGANITEPIFSNKSIIYARYKGIMRRRYIHGVIPCSRARYKSVDIVSFSFVQNHHNFSTKLFHETHSYWYKYFLFIFFVHSYCDKMNKVDNTVGACDRGLISLYVYNIYTSKKTLIVYIYRITPHVMDRILRV